MGLTIAKVGGSLFDHPALATRLRGWMATVEGEILLVPGGGAGADAIRRLDQIHRLGQEAAHWLALRVLSVNAEFLANLIDAEVVSHPEQMKTQRGVLDAHAFAVADRRNEKALEHSWRVTSDSIAARVAEVSQASLVLLKSVDLPDGMSWRAAAAGELVDEVFPSIVDRAKLPVKWVNLRTRQ